MKYNCDYCGALIDETEEKCPSCDAVNSHYLKQASSQPKTIEELISWYESKKLPPMHITRFFIGQDRKEPKCFGIYKDPSSGKVIVYKNKDTGERAIRYEGFDEAYAVNEIFQKLRETMGIQKAHNQQMRSQNSNSYGRTSAKKKKSGVLDGFYSFSTIIYVIILIICFIISFVYSHLGQRLLHPGSNRYYKYDDDYYYNLGGDYYIYGDSGWSYVGDAPFDTDSYKDFEVGKDVPSYGDISDFEDTTYYSDWYDKYSTSGNGSGSSDSDWGSSDSWDSGWDSSDSWDSDWGSDWGSDW